MNHDDLHAARLRFRALIESGVPDPINQFLIAEGLASPVKEVHITIQPPPRFYPPEGWRMPMGHAGYPFNKNRVI